MLSYVRYLFRGMPQRVLLALSISLGATLAWLWSQA